LGVLSVVVLSICSTVSAFAAGIIPAGTVLTVRTTQPIVAESSYAGMQFDAIVDEPVYVDGRVAVPRGTVATLEVVSAQQSSNLKGKDKISFRLSALHFADRSYSVATNFIEFKGRSEGKRTAQKVLGGAGIGAALGGIFGGGTGAALGAAAGGGTGAVIAGSGKTHLVVPAETRLQFRLSAPASI